MSEMASEEMRCNDFRIVTAQCRSSEGGVTHFPTAIIAMSYLIAKTVEVKERVCREEKGFKTFPKFEYRNVGRAGTNSLRFCLSGL